METHGLLVEAQIRPVGGRFEQLASGGGATAWEQIDRGGRSMETRLYMTMQTEGGGSITGSGTGQHDGQIPVCGFEHQVAIRADGARGHGKLVVFKALDGSSPRMTQALCKGVSGGPWQLMLTGIIGRSYFGVRKCNGTMMP